MASKPHPDDMKKEIARLGQENEQLRKKLVNYEILIRHMGLPMGLYDRHGRLILMNLSGADLINGDPDDFMGKHIAEFIPENSDIYMQRIGEAFQTQRTGIYEDTVNLPTGRRFFSSSYIPVRDETGTVFAVQIVSADLSDRKEMEDSLLEAKAYLHAVLDNADDIIVSRDTDGRVQVFNKAFSDIVKQLFGVDCHSGMRTQDFLSPEERKNWEEILQRVLNGEKIRTEFSHLFQDGEIRHYDLSFTPIIKNGQVIGSLELNRDITKIKALELKLVESVEMLDNVYASLDEAVFIVDPESRVIVSCNRAAEIIFGYDKSEMIGRNTSFLHVNEKTYKEFGEKLPPNLTGKGVFRKEFQLRRKNGETFYSEHSVKTVHIGGNRDAVHISVIRDITTQKNALRELENSQDELNRKNQSLEELNTTLKVMLEQRDRERKEVEETLSRNIFTHVLPYLDKIRKTSLTPLQKELLQILGSNLRELADSDHSGPSADLMKLSPSEIQVAGLIKKGFRNKEIAAQLNVSPRTIEFHRNNIRKKLGINDRSINLTTYLSSR